MGTCDNMGTGIEYKLFNLVDFSAILAILTTLLNFIKKPCTRNEYPHANQNAAKSPAHALATSALLEIGLPDSGSTAIVRGFEIFVRSGWNQNISKILPLRRILS